MLPNLDPDLSAEDSDDAEGGKRSKLNTHQSTAAAPQDCTDSDSAEDADGLGEESQSLKRACSP